MFAQARARRPPQQTPCAARLTRPAHSRLGDPRLVPQVLTVMWEAVESFGGLRCCFSTHRLDGSGGSAVAHSSSSSSFAQRVARLAAVIAPEDAQQEEDQVDKVQEELKGTQQGDACLRQRRARVRG